MKAKKLIAHALSVLLIGALAGCSQPVSVGGGASAIHIDRGEYLALKNGMTTQDISSVIDFIDNLESVVGDIGDYTTSYDKNTNTVYATTDTGNIAFHLDENGNVVFASANGSVETKTRLNQGITRVSIGNCIANQVSGVLSQVEQTKWLNAINANVIAAEVGGVNFTQLDTSLMYFETPALDNLLASDLERDVYGAGQISMPVLTETLANYGVQDMTNYYESPTLTKFWTGIDLSDMEASINQIVEDGIALGNNYANATLERPGLEVPEWSLTSYTLPSTFSDGTSTGNLGAQTLSAYEGFNTSLNSWKSSLLEQEEQAQLDGWADIQSANENGLNSITSIINDSQSSILEQAIANQNSIGSMTDSAIGSATDKNGAASGATSDKTSSAINSATDKNSAAANATSNKTNAAIGSANAQTNATQNVVGNQSSINQNAVSSTAANGQAQTAANETDKQATDAGALNFFNKGEDALTGEKSEGKETADIINGIKKSLAERQKENSEFVNDLINQGKNTKQNGSSNQGIGANHNHIR